VSGNDHASLAKDCFIVYHLGI